MKPLGAVILGLIAFGLAGSAPAQDDNTKKIVGKWVVDKSAGDLPPGTTIDFTADGKMTAELTVDGVKQKIEGKYKIDKERLEVTIKAGDMEIKETASVLKLTDTELEIKDKDGKIDTFKKK